MNSNLLGESWFKILEEEVRQPYIKSLMDAVKSEYGLHKVYPSPSQVFEVFKLTPFEEVKVIIIGQDPYHNGHAHGLAFSSLQKETPFSLQMIFREIDRDVVRTTNYDEFKQAFPTNNLTNYSKQGVFLLNTILTVRAGTAGSHANIGWEKFTKAVITKLYDDSKSKVFISWGAEAQKITNTLKLRSTANHLILESGHPATAAHGKDKFSGCNFASKTNRYLLQNNLPEINWRLNE